MTSEPSQQHGWQPADRNEPGDEAQNQRGFGLFDAPAAPDEFPVFTPYTQSRDSDEFPPDSDGMQSPSAFAGFPSDPASSGTDYSSTDYSSTDYSNAAGDWATSSSSSADQYVPAPAVLPIPGVRHDPEPASASTWSSSAEYYDPEPYSSSGSHSAAAAESEREDSLGGQSWSAFAAGDAPKLGPAPTHWSAAADSASSYEPSSYEPSSSSSSYEPSSSSSSYEPSSYESSSYESSSYESSSYESSSYESSSPSSSFESHFESSPAYESAYEPASSSSSYESSSPSYESSSYESPSSYETSSSSPSWESSSSWDSSRPESPAAYESPSYESPSYESPSYESSSSSSFEPSPGYGAPPLPTREPQPVSPAYRAPDQSAFTTDQEAGQPSQPAAAAPAVGSVRVAAAVPTQHRIDPQEVAAAAAIPKPAGRVYGSAAVAQPDPAGEAFPAAPAQQPVSPAAYPASPAPPPPAAPAASARATARASVPIARPNPGEGAPPPVTRSSTVYGSSTAGSAAVGAAAVGAPNPMGPPGSIPPAPGFNPQRQGRQPAFGDLLGPAAPEAPAGAPQIPAQRMPQPPGAPPVGAPPPSNMAMNPAPAAVQRASAQVSLARDQGQGPEQARFEQFRPTTTGSAPPAEPKPERKGRIIVGVLVACVALLAVAFGGLFLIDKVFNGPVFAVGDCVKQSDSEAIKADCTEPGAFEVKAAVSSPEQCQDQSQPHVEQDGQILCLAPAASTTTNPTSSPNPTPSS